MAFIIFFIFFLKKFEKVEKTGFLRAKFLLRCTLSVILGVCQKKFIFLLCLVSLNALCIDFFIVTLRYQLTIYLDKYINRWADGRSVQKPFAMAISV